VQQVDMLLLAKTFMRHDLNVEEKFFNIN